MAKMYCINLILVFIGCISSLFNLTAILLPVLGTVAILGMVTNALAIIRQYICHERMEITVLLDFVAFTLLFMLLIYNATHVLTVVIIGGVMNGLFIISSLLSIFHICDTYREKNNKNFKELVKK